MQDRPIVNAYRGIIDGFHGHPEYLELTLDELVLHSAKNKDYTKGGDSLGNFKRVANILSNYPGLDLSKPAVVAIVFAMKQMDRALWQMSQGYEGELEATDGSMADVHVYWKIARILYKEEQDGSRTTNTAGINP